MVCSKNYSRDGCRGPVLSIDQSWSCMQMMLSAYCDIFLVLNVFKVYAYCRIYRNFFVRQYFVHNNYVHFIYHVLMNICYVLQLFFWEGRIVILVMMAASGDHVVLMIEPIIFLPKAYVHPFELSPSPCLTLLNGSYSILLYMRYC